MRKDKGRATVLRKEGWSYKRLMAELGIPRATLSGWFSDKKWSQKIKDDLNNRNLDLCRERMIRLDKIRGENLSKVYDAARQDARNDFEILKNHPLFVAGIAIYWGEGNKLSKHHVRVANSDPKIIKVFLAFLRVVCGNDEDRIKAWILTYPDLSAETCEKYWSRQIGLSRNNFNKTIQIQGKHAARRVNYGVCTLGYSSRFLKEKMLIWMDLLADELLKSAAMV